MGFGGSNRRGDEPRFTDRELGLLPLAADLLRANGGEAVSIPALALRSGRGVDEVTAVFATTETLRRRCGQFLAVEFCEAVLAANARGGVRAAADTMIWFSEEEPEVFRQVLTGQLFKAGERLALALVRVFLPDVEVPTEGANRDRWFEYLRSHGHAAFLAAVEHPERRVEILVGAKGGAEVVSKLFGPPANRAVSPDPDLKLAPVLRLPR